MPLEIAVSMSPCAVVGAGGSGALGILRSYLRAARPSWRREDARGAQDEDLHLEVGSDVVRREEALHGTAAEPLDRADQQPLHRLLERTAGDEGAADRLGRAAQRPCRGGLL